MNRFSKPKPPPGAIYRHFAVVTLAVTALLAVFVNGEQREAANTASEAAVQREQAKQSPQKKEEATDRPDSTAGETGGSWGQDPQPPRDSTSESSWSPPAGVRQVAARSPARPTVPPMPARMASGGVPEEMAGQAGMRSGQAAGPNEEPSPEEMQDILRQSAERAGGDGEVLDL